LGSSQGGALHKGPQQLAGRAVRDAYVQECLSGYPNPNLGMATLRAPHACAPAQVWSTKQPSAVAAIDLRANVCCAKYNPARAHEVAVGCADHNVHLFDLRSAARPVHVFTGARAGLLPNEHGSGNQDADNSGSQHAGKACVYCADMQRYAALYMSISPALVSLGRAELGHNRPCPCAAHTERALAS